MDYVSVTPKLPKTIEKPRVIRKLTWRLVDRVVGGKEPDTIEYQEGEGWKVGWGKGSKPMKKQ